MLSPPLTSYVVFRAMHRFLRYSIPMAIRDAIGLSLSTQRIYLFHQATNRITRRSVRALGFAGLAIGKMATPDNNTNA